MATYFISDAHLGLGTPQEEKAKEDRLLAFLREAMGDAEELYIIGDLFDFWFDWATVVPRGFHRTLAALQEYTDGGRKVHYLVGNHDCWMKDFFETEIGVQLHREPFEAAIQGKRVYMHHGDGLADNDLGYRMIKPVLRNALAMRMFRLLHPDIAVRIARGTSHSSRAYTSNKHYGEEKGMIRFAEERIVAGSDIVIMGHHHKPSSVPLGHGVYINLGDWITYNTYGRMQDGAIALKTWNGQ